MSEALFTAVGKRTMKALTAALDGGADINAANPDDDENTALCAICKSKSGVMSKTEVQLALYLIDKGADVNKANDNNESPLHLAARSGNLEVIEALVKKGAKITRTKQNATPLFYCLSTHDKDTKLWDRLIALGCKIEDTNDSGDTPLLEAVSSHNPAAVKYLLAKGANKDHKDKQGKTALDYAIKYKNEKIQALLKK